MKKHAIVFAGAIFLGSLTLNACGSGNASTASSVAVEVSESASSVAAEAGSMAKDAGAALSSAAVDVSEAADSVAAEAGSVAKDAGAALSSAAVEVSEAASSMAESLKSDPERKTMEGNIEEIKDQQFIISTQSGTYLLTFTEAPEGLDTVKEGDTVTVTYSGELSEVDAFTGEVYSVEKK